MRSITAISALCLVAGLRQNPIVFAQQPTESPAAGLDLKTPQYVGCYSDPGDLFDMGSYTFQALGWCQPLCVRIAKPILAMVNGTNCFCGDDVPSDNDKVDDGECDTGCKGYPKNKCGGQNKFMVYSDQYIQGDPTGTVKIDIPSSTAAASSTAASAAATTDASSDSNSPAHAHASTVFITQSGHPVASVIQITQTASPTATASAGPNKAAIAAGVVISVVGLAAIIGAIVFYMRRKRQHALEEQRQRHEEMARFHAQGAEKAPSTHSASDSRLDPTALFTRRQSDGSIMDNQDYSRRILQVRNPDDA